MPKPSIDQTIIRQLAEILKDTDLSEIEVEQEGLRIRVARTLVATAHVAAPMPAPLPPAAVAAPVVAEPVATAGAGHPGAVTSPMVGTCYLAAEPGVRTFVSVGDSVRAGQTLLIIEAMKHMNQIPAPRAGKVTQILVEDGQPVEYGEALVVIE
jgi:acetyl-CoA carboxylase, biotin carboxyl carrier protein